MSQLERLDIEVDEAIDTMEKKIVKQLPPIRTFLVDMLYYGLVSIFMVIGSLVGGAWGYHVFSHMSWIDSFLNSAMILTGMGPVSSPATYSGKIFDIVFAMYSGIAFLGFVGVLFYPVYIRVMHTLHIKMYN